MPCAATGEAALGDLDRRMEVTPWDEPGLLWSQWYVLS